MSIVASIPPEPKPEKMRVEELSAYFGFTQALRNISVSIVHGAVTAVIGPSGSGKSTLLRCLNRMHETAEAARVEGRILIDNKNMYLPSVSPESIRKRVACIGPKPYLFPTMSVRDNVLAGLRLGGTEASTGDSVVRKSLERAGLWEHVRERLDDPGHSLDRSAQQRLCLARCLALEPEVILMDEPCSTLDPVGTTVLEELIHELKNDVTIVIATHSVQQAARVGDYTAFVFGGELVEYNEADLIFTRPKDRRTEDYITGRFG
jgi:phosphate transport system ATP-binding protein